MDKQAAGRRTDRQMAGKQTGRQTGGQTDRRISWTGCQSQRQLVARSLKRKAEIGRHIGRICSTRPDGNET